MSRVNHTYRIGKKSAKPPSAISSQQNFFGWWARRRKLSFFGYNNPEQKPSAEEHEAIEKATQLLRELQVERLSFPEWKGEL